MRAIYSSWNEMGTIEMVHGLLPRVEEKLRFLKLKSRTIRRPIDPVYRLCFGFVDAVLEDKKIYQV